ncbi:MAG: T9SS type A sorting domain-containing protein [Chitinophagales bacterium]|nr:T9SS type A sorting domain-containing protein [Chitinophagaceae bacterium]MCB9066166.1 T9SS type A sorting domain-containing protein [Chitinophagales bacterium]
MKRIFTLVCLTLVAQFTSINNADATIYTVVQSGPWSDSNTWQGMNRPPWTITAGNEVIITGPFNVILDSSVTFTGVGSKLELNAGAKILPGIDPTYFSFNGGELLGDGSIDVDSVYANFSTGGGFGFTGTLFANNFVYAALTSSQLVTLDIRKSLILRTTVDLGPGTLEIENGCTIYCEGGSIPLVSPSQINLFQPYHVVYRNAATTTGKELTGINILDIEVASGLGNTVTLSTQLKIQTTLKLTSGTLDLNGNSLIFEPFGKLSAGGAGDIASTSGASIRVNANSGLDDALRFSTTANTIDSLVINCSGTGAKVKIAGDVNVNVICQLQAGMVELNDATLFITTGALLSGGDNANHFSTLGKGKLAQHVAPNQTRVYPVGTGTEYAPASVKGNPNNTQGMVLVSAREEVLSNGTYGYNIDDKQPMVKHTWTISSAITATLDLDIELFWHASQEINSFDRSKCYIAKNSTGTWDDLTPSGATTQNGMFRQVRAGLSSLSEFAVFDQNTALSVQELNKQNNISIYPNPAHNVLHIDGKADGYATIYSITGQAIVTTNITKGDNSIDISHLPAGNYQVKIDTDETTTHRFTKQ